MNNTMSSITNLFNQPMVDHHLKVSLKPAIRPIFTAFFLLLLSAISLPSPGTLPILFRLSLLPFLFGLAYDILLNRDYSFGSPLRDTAFPSIAFIIVFRALDFAIINLWDPERAAHWIVPDESTVESKETPTATKDQENKHDDKSETEKKSDNSSESKVMNSKEPCRKWRRVPYPPLWSTDRLLWALDNLMLLRPGTPWLFPWRLRALSWSQRVLESPQATWATPEWPLLPAALQQIAHLICHAYIRRLNLDGSRPLWDEPLFVQCALTFALGGIVTFGNAFEEALLYPIITHFNLIPPTALVSNSRRAILSSGLVDLWGKRWHHVWRRSYVRLARLMPGANNPLVHAFATFYISAVMHCILLSRLYPNPTLSNPASFLTLIFEPGVMMFFLSQGIGTVIERVWLPVRPNDGMGKKLLRWLWLYFVLIGSGRWVTNTLVLKGAMVKDQWDMLNWSVVIKMLFGLIWPPSNLSGFG